MYAHKNEDTNEISQPCGGLHVIIMSDKEGVEREKEVRNALGRVIISNIKQKISHDKEK